MLGITQISAIWQFYLLRGVVVAIGFTFMGALVTDVAVNNWFIQKRGRAIAISRAGSNISNIILAPITVFVIAASGWRTMFVIFAVVTWLVVLIPSTILMRRRPEDIGLYPDGIEPSRFEARTHQESEQIPIEEVLRPEPIWSRRDVLMTSSFWLLAASFAIDSMAFQGVNISIAPYIQDLGYGDAMLAGVITFRAAVMAVAVLIMGFLAEHAQRASIRAAPFFIQALGALFFLLAEDPVFLWLAVTVYGLGSSGVLVTQEVVWANYFGRFSLGLVRSLGYFVAFSFGAIGPVAMNIVFDIMGSYRPAFVVIAVFFVMAAILMYLVRPAKANRYATAADMASTSGSRQ
jgi:MFS family permease